MGEGERDDHRIDHSPLPTIFVVDSSGRVTERKIEDDEAEKRDHAPSGDPPRGGLLSAWGRLSIGDRIKAVGIVVGIAGGIFGVFTWAMDRYARWQDAESHRDARKAIMTFVRSAPLSADLPANGSETYEAWFFFKNSGGGNIAKQVHSDDMEFLLVAPNGDVCNVAAFSAAAYDDVGPGEEYNIRVGCSVFMIRDMKLGPRVAGTLRYIDGVDGGGNESWAATPFCQKMIYDGQTRWFSCLGEPTPSCKRLEVE